MEILVAPEGYRCNSCDKAYWIYAGIPDFRVFRDPFLSFDQDRERTEIVLAELEHMDLRSLLEHYWTFSDITPAELRAKFVRNAMLGEQRAKRILRTFVDGTFKQPIKARRVLEIGSGTGNFLAVAAETYEQVIGIDIAMRWLHVSRRRFMDHGMPIPPLVCCCAEYLPFPDNYFDLVVASATLEFARDPNHVFFECSRTLKNSGSLYMNSANRYSISKDPYTYLWGVGYLPRAWQAKYVFWRVRASYEHIRTFSFHELNRMAEKYFATREFALPDIDAALIPNFSPFTRLQIHVYKLFRNLPLFSQLLKWFGTGWDAKFSQKRLSPG